MGATLYSRIKHPVLKTPDGGTKKRMNPILYWVLMTIGLFFVISLGIND
jgi:hypothetical protein